MISDDQMQKSSQGKNLSSQSKEKTNRDLIANSSLIKSYQAKDKIQKGKEDQVVLPEVQGAQKSKLVLEKDVVKKLPSTRNVLMHPFEGAEGKFNNLARKTENINMMDSKSNHKDVSMYSGELEQSFEELKEDLNSSIEGDANAGQSKKGSEVSQSLVSQNNGNIGNRKQSGKLVSQAKKNLILPPNKESCIKESMREYLSSEAYSPDEHHLTNKTGHAIASTGGPKLPGFVLNIKETQDENSSGPSEELASNLSKQTGKNTNPIDQDFIEKEIQQKLKEEILKIVGGPEPLYELSHKYAEGSDSPMWKRKQMRNRTIIDATFENVEQHSEASVSLSDGEEGSDLPGDQQSEKSDAKSFRLNDKANLHKKKKRKKNKAIQEKLERQGERIPIQTEKAINVTKHTEGFGYMIYDGYRPSNLAQTRDYLEFMTRSSENLGDDVLTENKTPPHILEYLERDIDTVLPREIDQKSILRFDQNFESGNLDSAYIVNPYFYNLLLKVDSNTRGNTYWFHFSVQGFKVGQRYTFNIQNFTRSMDKFYKDGMNVLTRSEDLGPDDVDALAEKAAGSARLPKDGNEENPDKIVEVEEEENPEQQTSKEADKNPDLLQIPEEQSKKEVSGLSTARSISEDKFKEWKYSQCENIMFDASDIPRTKNLTNMAKYQMSVKDKERYFYSMLSFSYRFKPEDVNKKVYFAYALPYGYSDLLHDLEDAKKTLLHQMSPLYNNQEKKTEENEQPEDPLAKDSIDNIEAPHYRIIDKTDIFDLAKMKNLSNFNNDKQYNTHQIIESPQGPAITSTNEHNSTGTTGRTPQVSKKVSFLQSGKQGQSNKSNAQFDFMHDQIKKQGTEFMQFKTSKFESDFIKKDQEKGTNQLKELILNEAAANPLSNQHNFEITNDYLQWRQEVIAQTMGGLNVFQITLTKRRKAGSIPHRKKQVIYIQARVHAAETHGSFIMSAIIKDMSQNYIKYDQILKDHIIKLVPMVNPDGVVLGNSRSSLAGVDLNRRWSNPNSTLHPELYFLKMSMRETKNDSKGISIFCDLHGHNKNSNCFIYGCNKAPNEGLLSWTKTRLLPKIFASYEPIFDFNMCKFSQEKAKYNTARVVIWNEFKVTNSFTLETSQYGHKPHQTAKSKRGKFIQLFQDDFNSIGINLLQSINKFVVIEAKLQKDLKKNGGWFKKKILDEITGQSARSKLDSQHNFSKQYHLRQNSQDIKQMTGTGAFAKKAVVKPGRHNTSDNLTLQNKLSSKKQVNFTNSTGKGSQRNLYSQANNSNNTPSKIENSAHKKRNSIRQGSEESLSLSDNGKGEKVVKTEINKSQVASMGVAKPQNQAPQAQAQLQNMGKMNKDNNSFRVTKTETSPMKGVDQPLTLSSKSPGMKAQSTLKKVSETPNKKTQLTTKKTGPLPDQSRKKMKDSLPEEPMKLPDCLAEFFSKNEFNSAVLESQMPPQPKEADTLSKQDEVEIAESDSEPSCDNFEVTEMKKIFSNAISEEDLNEVFSDELEPNITGASVEETNAEKTNAGDLNTVIEQISEHDEQQSQSIELIKPPPREVVKPNLIQLPGTKSPSVQIHSQNEMDTERLREQIKSIQDYKQIAKQLKSAQMESKKLADKFDSLSKQLNKKIKDETKQFYQPTVVQQQLFGSVTKQNDQQKNISTWDQVRDASSHNLYAAHARTSSLQPMSDIEKAKKQVLPAGPQSGEARSGERFRPRGASTNVIMHVENNSNLPAIPLNNMNHMNLMQRGKKKTMATTQAKASKYKSRNNVLSMSAYNMENGLATLTKNTNILGSIKAQQAQTHVHPQFAMTNQIMPKNQVSQGLSGVLKGNQVTSSPNKTSANRAKRKKKAELNDQSSSQLPTSPNIKQANMSHPLKSEQNQRNNTSGGGQVDQIRTIGSIPINNNASINIHQNQPQMNPQSRHKALAGKHISMPVGNVDGESNHWSSQLYQSESQSFVQSSNEINFLLQQHHVLSNQAMVNQVDKLRKDVQTSPVQKGGYYLNSSLEWVQSKEGERMSPVQFPKQGSQEKQSENSFLRVQDMGQVNRNRKMSPSSILFNQSNSSGNKLRKEVINARQNLEDSIQNQYIISQSINTANTPQKVTKNDYQEDYNQMQQMNDNIHNVLHILPSTSIKKNARKVSNTDMTQNVIQFKNEPNQIARNSVQFNNQERSQQEEVKAKSMTTNRNFFQNENVKQYLHNQQIILKPHQIRRGAADQIIQQDYMNNEIINKQRRYNNTKFNSNIDQNAYDPVSSIPREQNSVLQNVPQRVSIPNLSERNKVINIQSGIGSSPKKVQNNNELTPQNMKHKMIKTKTQQVEQTDQAYAEMFEQNSGNKHNNPGLQSNYNKKHLTTVNSNNQGQIIQQNKDLQSSKTTAISPINKSRLNRMSYINSNQVQHNMISPQQASLEIAQMNELIYANTPVNNHDQIVQSSGQRFQEIHIEDNSRGSNSNYNYNHVIQKNSDLILNQGKSRRYAANSNIPSTSPNKPYRNYGPTQFDYQFATDPSVGDSIEKIPQILISPRPAVSQTPGTNFYNKIIRKSIPVQQSPNQMQQRRDFQDFHESKRIHTESEHQQYLSPVRIIEATSTGIVTTRKTIAQFGDNNFQNNPNSVMNERRHLQLQQSTPKADRQKGAQIKMSKQQVQNIIKQQMNKN